jgi:hypothetical protein
MQIPENCNAVVFYNWIGELNGSVINAFEYFISILENGGDIYLLFVNSDKELKNKFIEVFENRYNLDNLPYKERFIPVKSRRMLLHRKFRKVLILDYSTIFKLKGLINADEIVVIQEKHTKEKDYQFTEGNVVRYGEMPFQLKDYEYRMKLLFGRFRKLRYTKEGIYVNSPKNDNYSFLDEIIVSKKPKSIIVKSRVHRKNLFEHFDTYLYYHANKWFDPHPRLFLECAFYGKDIIYFNNYKILDGSFYRYYDLLENGLKDRTLNSEDEIVRKFI